MVCEAGGGVDVELVIWQEVGVVSGMFYLTVLFFSLISSIFVVC